VKDIISEFFASGDIPEAITALLESDHPGFHHYFVKKLVIAALDRHDRDRELTCVLLSSLYGEVAALQARLLPALTRLCNAVFTMEVKREKPCRA
jgi:MA3 domain